MAKVLPPPSFDRRSFGRQASAARRACSDPPSLRFPCLGLASGSCSPGLGGPTGPPGSPGRLGATPPPWMTQVQDEVRVADGLSVPRDSPRLWDCWRKSRDRGPASQQLRWDCPSPAPPADRARGSYHPMLSCRAAQQRSLSRDSPMLSARFSWPGHRSPSTPLDDLHGTRSPRLGGGDALYSQRSRRQAEIIWDRSQAKRVDAVVRASQCLAPDARVAQRQDAGHAAPSAESKAAPDVRSESKTLEIPSGLVEGVVQHAPKLERNLVRGDTHYETPYIEKVPDEFAIQQKESDTLIWCPEMLEVRQPEKAYIEKVPLPKFEIQDAVVYMPKLDMRTPERHVEVHKLSPMPMTVPMPLLQPGQQMDGAVNGMADALHMQPLKGALPFLQPRVHSYPSEAIRPLPPKLFTMPLHTRQSLGRSLQIAPSPPTPFTASALNQPTERSSLHFSVPGSWPPQSAAGVQPDITSTSSWPYQMGSCIQQSNSASCSPRLGSTGVWPPPWLKGIPGIDVRL